MQLTNELKRPWKRLESRKLQGKIDVMNTSNGTSESMESLLIPISSEALTIPLPARVVDHEATREVDSSRDQEVLRDQVALLPSS